MNSSISSMSQVPEVMPEIPVPSRVEMADMLRFYATPEVRTLLMSPWPEDRRPLEDELVDRLRERIESWTPPTMWHWQMVVVAGRTVEWLAWQTALEADPEMGPVFRDEAIVPFAIDLEELPRYDQLPTMIVRRPDGDVADG